MPRWIGEPVPRREARAKVTGAARYVDDLRLPGMLLGATVRSPVARGTIRAVRFGDGIPWDEVVVVTARDLPGRNVIQLLMDDQPCLANGVVNHPEEPVLLLAHADRDVLAAARRAVTIEVEPLPAVFTLEESLRGETVIWGADNVFKRYTVARGDLAAAFARADLVVEGTYETGAQEQLYIEPQGMLATFSATEGITVWGSLQCPYYVHKALRALFGLPAEKVRVIQAETGGGFGGKEEYPSILAAHAALLAAKSGRPVKMIYDRAEDMAATTKRHPSRTRLRTGVTRDGRLLALEAEFLLDGGAYCTLSPVVLSRGTIHLAGPYAWEAVRIESRALATSAPPHGAFRGFGAPQGLFATECHLDEVARALGMEPATLRRRNFVQKGATLAVGQTIQEEVDLGGLMDRAFALADYDGKRARFAVENRRAEPSAGSDIAAGAPDRLDGNARAPRVLRGVGFASFLHGAGFTGSGEVFLKSVVAVEADAAGRVRLRVASVEIGQGTNTVLTQIAAETLGVDLEQVELLPPDTAAVPDSGPTVASRTVMVVGKLVESACEGLLATLRAGGLLGTEVTPDAFAAACAAHHAQHGALLASSQYEPPPGVRWDDETYTGDAYGAYAWAVYVATVAVDTLTWEARVEDFVAVQEVGRVIHPVLAAGQIEGGVVQAIGWALCEDVVWEEGRMRNAQMTNYIIPTAADVPPIRVEFLEQPYAYGPAGAKGIGELPMDGPAPAIVNAIAHATGVRVRRIPVTPEVLMRALDEAVPRAAEASA
jgi:CO/xanthine dehydrogenase Mo-binding subunit